MISFDALCIGDHIRLAGETMRVVGKTPLTRKLWLRPVGGGPLTAFVASAGEEFRSVREDGTDG